MGEKFILTFYKGRAIQIPYTTPIKKDFDLASLAEENGISLSDIDMEELSIGLEEELEHSDVTGGELKPTFQIVVAHLKEDPKYYSKLEEAGLVAKGGPGSGRRPEGGETNLGQATVTHSGVSSVLQRNRLFRDSDIRLGSDGTYVSIKHPDLQSVSRVLRNNGYSEHKIVGDAIHVSARMR